MTDWPVDMLGVWRNGDTGGYVRVHGAADDLLDIEHLPGGRRGYANRMDFTAWLTDSSGTDYRRHEYVGPNPPPGIVTVPRRFQLDRSVDVTGASGVGVVADGVLWPDGTVSIRWRGPKPSVVFWEDLAHAEAVHGHGGHTRFVWLDE